MKERGSLLQFEWFKVSDAKKSKLVYKVERIAKALTEFGFLLPSKVIIGSEVEWKEIFGEAASGAALREKKTIYLSDDPSPDTIIHEIIHITFPNLDEDGITSLTEMCQERLERDGVLTNEDYR